MKIRWFSRKHPAKSHFVYEIVNGLDLFPKSNTKSSKNNIVSLYSCNFLFTLATLKIQLTVSLSRLASSLATRGTVILLEKGCTESWDSDTQLTVSPSSINMCPAPLRTNST